MLTYVTRHHDAFGALFDMMVVFSSPMGAFLAVCFVVSCCAVSSSAAPWVRAYAAFSRGGCVHSFRLLSQGGTSVGGWQETQQVPVYNVFP